MTIRSGDVSIKLLNFVISDDQLASEIKISRSDRTRSAENLKSLFNRFDETEDTKEDLLEQQEKTMGGLIELKKSNIEDKKNNNNNNNDNTLPSPRTLSKSLETVVTPTPPEESISNFPRVLRNSANSQKPNSPKPQFIRRSKTKSGSDLLSYLLPPREPSSPKSSGSSTGNSPREDSPTKSTDTSDFTLNNHHHQKDHSPLSSPTLNEKKMNRLSGKFGQLFSRKRSNTNSTGPPIFSENTSPKHIHKNNGSTQFQSPQIKTKHFPAPMLIEKPLIQGYLNKKNKKNRWKKRYCVLNNEYLHIFKNQSSIDPPAKISMFCVSVKLLPTAKKDFSFQVFTADSNHDFCADSEKNLIQWTGLIHFVATTIVTETLNSKDEKKIESKSESEISEQLKDINKQNLLKIWKHPENQICADCSSPSPKWASINLGIFICIECSGGHRKLGTHISQVRSVELDKWDSSTVENMNRIGNYKSNLIFENCLDPHQKPTSNEHVDKKVGFIKKKYESGLYKLLAQRIYLKFESKDGILGFLELYDVMRPTLAEVRTKIPTSEAFQFVLKNDTIPLLQEADTPALDCLSNLEGKSCLILRIMEFFEF